MGLVELDKSKNKKCSTGLIDKTEVPFLCVSNLPEAVLSVLIDCDREETYVRHPYQSPNEWDLLWAGDMGASSTKFGFFNCRRRKFNAGQHLNLCSMFVQAPDSRKNLDKVLSSDIAPGLQAVKSSCILRVRNRCKKMYAGALIPLAVPCLIPSFFMEWAIPAEDADEFEDAEAAPMEKDQNLSSPSEVELAHEVHLSTHLKLCLALSNTLQTLLTVFIF